MISGLLHKQRIRERREAHNVEIDEKLQTVKRLAEAEAKVAEMAEAVESLVGRLTKAEKRIAKLESDAAKPRFTQGYIMYLRSRFDLK